MKLFKDMKPSPFKFGFTVKAAKIPPGNGKEKKHTMVCNQVWYRTEHHSIGAGLYLVKSTCFLFFLHITYQHYVFRISIFFVLHFHISECILHSIFYDSFCQKLKVEIKTQSKKAFAFTQEDLLMLISPGRCYRIRRNCPCTGGRGALAGTRLPT